MDDGGGGGWSPPPLPPRRARPQSMPVKRPSQHDFKVVRARSQAECFTGRKQQLKPNNSALRRKIWFRRHGSHLGVMAAKKKKPLSPPKLPPPAPVIPVHERPDLSPGLQWRLSPDEAIVRFLAYRPLRPATQEQITGSEFMMQRYKRQCVPKHVRGGGLFDGMRMGKCQTVILFLLSLLQELVQRRGVDARFGHRARPVLIVGTKECVPQWRREFELVLGPGVLQVEIWDTKAANAVPADQRQRLLDRLQEETDVIITSYSLLSLTRNHYLADFLLEQHYRVLVCDEAHNIFNSDGVEHLTVASINAKTKWILTGTPIQNNVARSVTAALRLMGVEAEELARFPTVENMVQVARQLVVRRTKEPPTPIPVQSVTWTTPLEASLYAYAEQGLLADLQNEQQERKTGIRALRVISLLRKFCISPYLVADTLFDEDLLPLPGGVMFFPWTMQEVFDSCSSSQQPQDSYEDAMDVQDDLMLLMHSMVLEALQMSPFPPYEHPLRSHMIHPVSAKERWICVDVLSQWADKCHDKVVIFSNYREPLKRLAFLFDLRLAWGVPGARRYAHVHGDQDADVRDAERQWFQEDAECGVLLAMIDVNKESVSLTAANHVILLDPWWNPTVEGQALARVDGVQQMKQVHRYRLTMEDSVESMMTRRADSKIQMDRDAFPPTLVGEETESMIEAAAEADEEEEATAYALEELFEHIHL